ncbi:MAG: hypothetical protein DMF47_05115 [Verrucomicrobia bacterium]|nr:MAG: hypothetical protein DMF47_05115 [Verrucomicrobiota bacterium]
MPKSFARSFAWASSSRRDVRTRKAVDRPLRGRCYYKCSFAAMISIELAAGRVRPLADKGLLDPPSRFS